jgi:hypothetical protein
MRSILICGALALGPLFIACGELADPTEQPAADPVGANMEAIVGGTPATAYREGAVLNMKSATGLSYACSATLIAPKVVLTAGHCVDGMVAWDVYVGTAYKPAASAETYDWNEHGASTVNPLHHDIGLVYLKDPITLATYPAVNAVKQADGTKGVAVGRVLNGTVTSALYQANSSISDGMKIGFPYAYYSPAIIEHGDSGGPFFLLGTHTVAAVNSGAGSGTQVLARVDLLSTWIAERIASHGGMTGAPMPLPAAGTGAAGMPSGAAGVAGAIAGKGGAGGAAGAAGAIAGKGGAGGAAGVAGAIAGKGGAGGTSATGGTTGTAGAKASAGTGASGSGGALATGGTTGSAACVAELEPNNDLAHATAMTATTCGSLSTNTDTDWFVMPVGSGTTTITLTADKDATFSIGYVAGTMCATALTGARQVQISANGANPKVCLLVSSATHATQTYKLSR